MSIPKHNERICWKWRNAGVVFDGLLERSPMTRIKNAVEPENVSVSPSEQDSEVLFSRTSNKREETCTKMGERQMVRQIGMNPFLQTDYVKGIEIRDKFLIPYHESKPSYEQGA